MRCLQECGEMLVIRYLVTPSTFTFPRLRQEGRSLAKGSPWPPALVGWHGLNALRRIILR